MTDFAFSSVAHEMDPEKDSPRATPFVPVNAEFTAEGRSFTLDSRGALIEAPTLGDSRTVATRKFISHPVRIADESQLDNLIEGLSSEIRQLTPLSRAHAFLTAAMITSSWVTDSLPVAPVLCMFGSLGSHSALRQIALTCSRRSISLDRVVQHRLTRLPMDLHPSLVAFESERPESHLLARISGGQGPFLDETNLSHWKSSLLIFSNDPLDGLVSIPCDADDAIPYKWISDVECERIRSAYVPRLARFRLEQHAQASSSSFHLLGVSAEARELGRSLGSALEGHPDMQERLAQALRAVDQDLHIAQSDSLPSMIVEVLIKGVHSSQGEVSIAKLTEAVNLLNRWRRGGPIGSKKISAVIRRDLRLTTIRRAAGFVLLLDSAAQNAIHRAARLYGLHDEMSGNCSLCQLGNGTDGANLARTPG